METDEDDSPGSEDVASQVVTAAATGSFTAANVDSLSISRLMTKAVSGFPITITFNGSDTPYDADGDTPALYALVRAANGVGCQPTFGEDQQVAGSDDASVLLGGDDSNNTISDGNFSYPASFTPAAGSYTVCAWLETDGDDSPGSEDGASRVVTAVATSSFTVPAAPRPACVVPSYRSETLTVVEVSLQRRNCAIGRLHYMRDRSVKRGRVIRLSSQPGHRYAYGTKIAITVSNG